jgi:hypothetical protein
VRLARRDVRDHIKYSKTDCGRSYRFYTPSGGWNRQHASFARFSKPRDFRVFQHNPPIAADRNRICFSPRCGHPLTPEATSALCPRTEVAALLVAACSANDVRASIRRKFHVKAERELPPKVRLLTDARVDAQASRQVIGSEIAPRGRYRGRTSRPDRERRR